MKPFNVKNKIVVGFMNSNHDLKNLKGELIAFRCEQSACSRLSRLLIADRSKLIADFDVTKVIAFVNIANNR